MATARSKADAADEASMKAHEHSDLARIKAKEVAPEFHQPGTDVLKKQMDAHGGETDMAGITPVTPQPNNLQRSSTLAMRRHGSAGNGSIGTNPRDLKLITNHNGGGGAKYSTLPNNISKSATPRTPYDEEIAPQSARVQKASAPMIGNHVTPRTPGTAGGWGDTPDGRTSNPMLNSRNHRTPTTPGPQANGRPPTQRLSTMHMGESFDHVAEQRDNSRLGQDFDTPVPYIDRRSEDRYSVDRYSEHSQSAQQNERVANPMFSSLNTSSNSMNRRKSVPSIVHQKKSIQIDPKAKTTSGHNQAKPISSGGGGGPVVKTTRDDIMDTYVIENGVRKRVKAEVVVYPRPPSPSPSQTSVTSIEDKPKDLPQVYKLEPSNLAASRNRGSMPDVRKDLGIELLPRTVVKKMSEARRLELRRMREMEEERRQMEIVLRVADIKDWCQQRQLLILVIALNVGLATMFFNILN